MVLFQINPFYQEINVGHLTTYLIMLFSCLSTSVFAQPDGPWPWVNSASQSDEVSILLMGDMNLQHRDDPADAFEHFMPTLKAADLRFCNLEGPFAGPSDPLIHDIPHKKSWRHSDPEMVEGLVAAGFDAVGVANNVTYPYTALLKSLKVLDKAGIPHTGGGNNRAEAIKPVILEVKGTRIGIVQYATTVFPFDHAATETQPGIAEVKVTTSYQPPPNLDKPAQPAIPVANPDPASLQSMKDNIHSLKNEVDVVIASYHWGVSNMLEPDEYQRIIAREAINAGADLILGHGAHKLQIIEIWKNKPIFYCTGNAVFDWWKIRKSLNGLLIQAVVKDKKLKRVSFVPLQRNENNQPILYDPATGVGKELVHRIDVSEGMHRARLRTEGKEIVVLDADHKEEIPVLEESWEAGGFERPECLVFDPQNEQLLVGNMNGDQPGDGYISRVSKSGEIIEKKWITGLNEPKGMAISGNTLWLNDINQIVKIDIAMGEIVEKITVPLVVELNDLSIDPEGTLFTNDADGHKMYVLKNGKPEIYWEDVSRGRPNGVLAEENRLLVATTNSHKLLSIDKATRLAHVLSDDVGRGDGIEAVGNGGYLISDYSGRIFYLTPEEFLHTLHDSRGQKLTADFEFVQKDNLLVVPTHQNHTIKAFKLQFPKM